MQATLPLVLLKLLLRLFDFNVVRVYLAKLPELLDESKLALLGAARAKELNNIKNERVRREKYHVWRLLEYALSDALGFDISSLAIEKNENGKWICPSGECYFSISHSRGALCVAVSDISVGVDVEEIRSPSSDVCAFAQKILNEKELVEFSRLDESLRIAHLISKWTQKEAIFKRLGGKTFTASDISTENDFCQTEKFILEEKEYFVSVSAEQDFLLECRIAEL